LTQISGKNFTGINLTLIGTGTIRSKDSRACSAVLIESSESTLLVDCGPGSWLRLRELNKDLGKIDHIFLSHFHPDHIIDLVSILFSRYHSSSRQSHPIHIWGAAGLSRFFSLMVEAFGEWLEDSMFQVEELLKPVYHFSDFTLKYSPVFHARESVGYRFERNKRVIAISGDSGYCPELIELSRYADIAILECSFPDDRAEEHHLTPTQAGQVARQAGVKKLILTHLYPEVFQTEIGRQVSQQYAGPVHIAQDGDLITL